MAGIDFASGFQNIDLVPSLKQEFNNKVLKRSARELAQELVSQSIVKPVYTDNWDILIEYSPASWSSTLNSLIGVGKGIKSMATAGVDSFKKGFGAASKDLAKAGGNLFLKSGKDLITNLSNKLAMQKLSVRTTDVSLPVLEVVNEFLKFGPLRYHYTVDYEYKNFSMTVIEDEETPLYPIFEAMLNTNVNFEDGTFNEPGKSQVDIYLTIYSDYTGFSFITYFLKGCHLKSISIGGSGGQSSSLDRGKDGKVEPLTYKIEFDIDGFQVVFNKLNPMVSFASRSVPVSNVLQKIGSVNQNLFK
jgi:hypothetical protein